MLFICHQMAMKKEAEDKLKAEEIRRAQIGVGVPIVWVLGGPGCGKGTQCDKIVEMFGFTHLSTGDLLRIEVSSGSEKGRQLEEIMKAGRLVSNEDVLGLLEKAIRDRMSDSKGFLIDGYPREKDQGVAFEQRIAPADLVLYFECSDETMKSRILGRAAASEVKRADDNEETIKQRLATFRENTNSILGLYKNKTLTVNAERPVDDIFNDVRRCLECLVQKKQQVVACS